MVISTRLKAIWQNYESRNTIVLKLFSKSSFFTKIKLKRPLFRGSRFKIYFRLECRRNQGSRPNFHGILFSKDCIFIKPDYFVTYHSMITCLSNKNKQFTSKHGCKKHRHEHWLIRTKIRLETTIITCSKISLFAIFYEFNKQNMLANNN